jgi:hypothetical protein
MLDTWEEFSCQANSQLTPTNKKTLRALQILCVSHKFLTYAAAIQRLLNTFQAGERSQDVKDPASIIRAVLSATESSEDAVDKAIHTRYLAHQKKFNQGKSVILPAYYHMTKQSDNFSNILSTGSIDVTGRGLYPGAWVSTRIEEKYGKFGFSVTSQMILNANPNSISPDSGFPYSQRKEQSYYVGLKHPSP